MLADLIPPKKKPCLFMIGVKHIQTIPIQVSVLKKETLYILGVLDNTTICAITCGLLVFATTRTTR